MAGATQEEATAALTKILRDNGVPVEVQNYMTDQIGMGSVADFAGYASVWGDAEDYYERASCGQYLEGIRVPTRIIHALDDPMMVPEIVPDPSSLPEAVELLVSPRGGHVGFVAAGQGGVPRMWLEHSLPEWLDARLQPEKDATVAGECA